LINVAQIQRVEDGMGPTEIAERYFASVRARDIESFMALFADDAVFISTSGATYTGAADIREMELGIFATTGPMPTPGVMIAGENGVAVEIEVRLPDGEVRRVGSFFHTNKNSRIQRLSVYRQDG
jgi:hypothetical protein